MLNLATNELLVTTFNSSQDLMTFPNVRNNVVMLHQNVSQFFLIFKTNVMEQKVNKWATWINKVDNDNLVKDLRSFLLPTIWM